MMVGWVACCGWSCRLLVAGSCWLRYCYSIPGRQGASGVGQTVFRYSVVCHNRRIVPQDAQKGRSARPQASRNRRRTLRGTLRISMSRERSWRAFSASCYLAAGCFFHFARIRSTRIRTTRSGSFINGLIASRPRSSPIASSPAAAISRV